MVRVIPKLCDMDISISIFPISRVFVSTATDLGSQTMIALITILKSILLNTIFFCWIKFVIQFDKAFTPSSYLYFLVRNQWAFSIYGIDVYHINHWKVRDSTSWQQSTTMQIVWKNWVLNYHKYSETACFLLIKTQFSIFFNGNFYCRLNPLLQNYQLSLYLSLCW